MNIHEYQAKQILVRFGVPVPKGQHATSADEAAAAFTALGKDKAVVKAQIHAGGRGKAGGVKLLSSAGEARDFAAKLLGKPLVTHQTGPEGRVVRRRSVLGALGWVDAGGDGRDAQSGGTRTAQA